MIDYSWDADFYDPIYFVYHEDMILLELVR